MSAPLRAKKSHNTIALILLGLLVISLTGFGVRSVGSGRNQTVASVGTQEVSVGEYVRALNSQVRALSQQLGQNVSIDRARTFGIERFVAAQVLATAALDGENTRIGLSIGDETVRKQVLNTPAFQGSAGQFDATAYKFALEQAGMKPADYDVILRREGARALLQNAISGGVHAGRTYADALLAYVGETRSFDWAPIGADLLPTPTRNPTDAEINETYTANPETYTAPEKRQLTYVVLTPEMLLDTITPDEAELRAVYDSQPERFNTPARRNVDRIAFANKDEAAAAVAAIQSGDKTFDDVVTERGLNIGDVSLGVVARADLGSAAADAVFAMTQPGIAGPVETTLGPAVFRVNAVLAAVSQPFDQVKDTLHKEVAIKDAKRMVDNQMTAIDDLLAGGASLEDVAAETPMKLVKTDYVAAEATGVPASKEFRTAAAAAKSEDFPELVTLSNGGVFALRLEKIIAPALKPLDEVKTEVVSNWIAAENIRRMRDLAKEIKTKLDGGATFQEAGLTPKSETGIRRQGTLVSAPQGTVAKAFGLEKDGVDIVESNGTLAVVRLTGITAFDATSDTGANLETQVVDAYAQQVGNDILDGFIRGIQDREGVSINQSLINAIYTQNAGRGSRHLPTN